VDPIISDAILGLVDEVPEPSTFVLLGIALTALGFARRRQIGGSVSQHYKTHGCAYPLGSEVTGVRLGRSGTGASAGWAAAEPSS
jgi:hypothetical protein